MYRGTYKQLICIRRKWAVSRDKGSSDFTWNQSFNAYVWSHSKAFCRSLAKVSLWPIAFSIGSGETEQMRRFAWTFAAPICYEALPGVWGSRGNKAIYFRGTREQKSKTEGNRGTKAILGNREHRKSRFWFWGTRGKCRFYFRGTRKQVPHPPLPPGWPLL